MTSTAGEGDLPEGWIAIEYRDYWDVPHAIILRLPSGATVFLDAPFDERFDEYVDRYTGYLLPDDVDLSGSWEGLEE